MMGNGERTGTSRQGLVAEAILDEATQESFGVLSLNNSCTASLLRNDWAITAAHCVELKDAFGNRMPDPARPGQFLLMPPGTAILSANWGGGQAHAAVQIITFRPYDIAIIRVSAPFNVHGSTTGFSQLVFNDGQFPYWGEEVPVGVTVLGRGINTFAKKDGSAPSSGDNLFRVGMATTTRKEDGLLYWYSSATGTFIAGGDSGGPSFAWVLNGYALMGVHSLTHARCADGMQCGSWGGPGPVPAGYDPWLWVYETPEAADAPIKPVWNQILQIIGPFTSQREPALEPPPPGYIGTLGSGTPSRKVAAMRAFQHRATAAADAGFAAGFPNFYEATSGRDHVGGTIFIKAAAVEWHDVPLSDLGNVSLFDFEERIRATNAYATRNGFVGGFPNFFHADYGSGIVCGTILLKSEGAEWRDVNISDLGNPALGDFEHRFRATQDYANRNGFVGGFPNLFHAEKQNIDFTTGRRTRATVCGTVLLKPSAAEWRDVLLFRGPA
jgi:hypothetical protein